MTSPALMRNIGAFLMPEGEGATYNVGDATYVTGAIVDRQALGNPLSCVAIASVMFTASAAAGSNTLTIQLLDSSSASMTSATAFDSDTYAYTCSSGANFGIHTLPVDLSSAERYVRVRAKMTKATSTIASQAIGVGILFGGLEYVPNSSYAAAGNEATTEA